MSTTTQPDLFDTRDTSDGAVELAALWLVSFLQGRGFTPSGNILRAMNLPVTEDNKRWLRNVRVATRGHVIGGPGFPGYVLLARLTLEDFQHWKRSMRSQARNMIGDILRTEKLYHELIARA